MTRFSIQKMIILDHFIRILFWHNSGIPYTPYSFRVRIRIRIRVRVKVRISVRVRIRVRD